MRDGNSGAFIAGQSKVRGKSRNPSIPSIAVGGERVGRAVGQYTYTCTSSQRRVARRFCSAAARPRRHNAIRLLAGQLVRRGRQSVKGRNTGVIDPFAASHNAAPLSREEFIEEFLQQSRGLQKASRKYKWLQELLDFLSFTVRRLRIQDPLKAVSMLQYTQFVSDASARWEAPETAVLDYHYKFVQSQYDFDPAVRADVFAVGGFRHAESMRGTLLLWERQYEELQCSRKYCSSASAAASLGRGRRNQQSASRPPPLRLRPALQPPPWLQALGRRVSRSEEVNSASEFGPAIEAVGLRVSVRDGAGRAP